MNNEYTHISVVLDNSGSMESIKKEVITSFNAFIRKQKEVPGRATFSLYNFRNPGSWSMFNNNAHPFLGSSPILHNSKVNIMYRFTDLQSTPELNDENYICETMTPLLDTIGVGIVDTGDGLRVLPEALRPKKVIFVIITDGQENDSVEHNLSKIKEMITHQTDIYKWEFVFLAANQDAIAVGSTYGIGAGSSMNFVASAAGTIGSTAALSEYVSRSRSSGVGVATSFTPAERDMSMGGGFKSSGGSTN